MPAPPPTAYDRVEGWHLRQWALRVVPPLGILATNGAGPVDLPSLPRWDAPLRTLGLPPWVGDVTTVSGAVLVLAAAVLRVRAKGVLVRKTTVTTSGAYSLVRHPFYLANLAGAAGVFCLAGPLGATAGAVWLGFALPVYLVTIGGEERGLRRLHGEAWDAYARAVPRLLPGGSKGSPGGDRVTWRNLVAEGEPPRGLRFLAGALAVAACRVQGMTSAALGALALLSWLASHVVARCSRPPGEC